MSAFWGDFEYEAGLSAFWDDYAMELASDGFVTYFIGACEHIANLEIGLVPCGGDHSDCAPDEDGWHAFTCVECGAVV